MRIAALVVLVTSLIIPSSFVLLVVSYLLNDHQLIIAGVYALALTALMIILRWFFTLRTHCPLCMGGVMAKNSYSKHLRAKSIFGSHRLRVALSILLANRFTCPYCNERAVLELRK